MSKPATTLKTKPPIEIYTPDAQNSDKPHLVCRIDRVKKEGSYHILPSRSQAKWIESITLEGFDKFPAGLDRRGKGLLPGKNGYLISKQIFETLGKFHLVISASGKTEIRHTGGKPRITLNHTELRALQDTIKEISSEAFKGTVETISARLIQSFPAHFTGTSTKDAGLYQGNQLERVLKRRNILGTLSTADVRSLTNFFPEFLKKYRDKIKGSKQMEGVLKSKNEVAVVFLEELAAEFEKRLRANKTEHTWQQFFREHFLLFNPNYIHVFEKKNLSLAGKFPDFLPIDLYGHLDIFDIKKPDTRLMEFDKDRHNYYWSKELAKAIAQVESYISSANTYGPQLIQEIRKKEQLDINVVRPRGFVIAGTREQLVGIEEKESFRMLNDSLKNIRILLYDDVLDNLKAFLKKASK